MDRLPMLGGGGGWGGGVGGQRISAVLFWPCQYLSGVRGICVDRFESGIQGHLSFRFKFDI